MIRDLSLILSVLTVTCATTVGPWILRKLNQAFIQKVEELPPYPIVLKPYRMLMALYLTVGTMGLALFIAMSVLSRKDIAMLVIFGLPSLVISAIGFIAAYLYSCQSIVLEVDKLIYKKSSKKIVLPFSDIIGFGVVVGYLNLKRKSDGSTTKISLYFKNIRYLNTALKQWFTRSVF